MNKLLCRLVFFTIAIMFCVSANAHAAKTTMLFVPFTVNAPDSAKIASQIQSLVESELKKQNFAVKIASGAPATSASNAKQKASSAGTRYAMYGTYNQVGQAFTLEARIVQVGSNLNRPYYEEGRTLGQLPKAVESIASKMPFLLQNKVGISDIVVRGVEVLDPERITMRVKTRVGDAPNAESMEEDVRTIWDMGYFSDVSASLEPDPVGDGEILVFDVVEKPRIINVRVLGSDAVDEEDVIGAMNSTAGTVLNDSLLAEDLHVVKELYRKKGYYLADINYTIENSATGNGASLILNVDAGNKLYITQVNMNGVDEKMQKKLRKFTKLRKHGFFSFFTKYGVLEEEYLQRDMDAVHAYLIDKGYLDVVVEYPEVTFQEDGIIIDFNIQPGQRYKIGNIDFEGDLLLPKEELLEYVEIDKVKEKEEYFSLATLQKDMESLKNLYNDFGFAFAEVSPATPMNREESIVDIIYQLNPKEKVYIRNVFLEGNIETRDNVILRELRIADGQQYDGAKVRRSIERLYALEFFDDVNIDLIPTGTPGEVDLKVVVKESNTGSISMGIGYSTYDHVGFSAAINQKNLFGRAYNVGLNGYISGKTTSIRGTFMNPRINDTKLGFMASVYAEDQEWLDYDKDTIGTTWGLSYPLGEYTGISASYRLEFYDLTDVAPNASWAIKSYEGNNISSVISTTISRNTTDHPLMPTRGTKQSLSFEYGGGFLGGSDNFYKLMASYGFYYGLNPNHVLHARATVGAVFQNGDDPIPAFERFYIGGMNSLRGYDYEDISPIDPYTGESIGATNVLYASIEYIWRVNEEFSIFLVPFFDYGLSYDKDYDSMMDREYYSAGLEVRWNSPFGALRFAYGVPFTDSVIGQDLSGRFEFSMGRAF